MRHSFFATLACAAIVGAFCQACGDDVESGSSASAQGSSGGGQGGSGGAPAACMNGLDDAVKALLGKACATADEVCASNNGCGGCSVTCKDGVWVSTDAQLCYSVGEGC